MGKRWTTARERPGMRRYPEPGEGTLRPSRRKAWVTREGRTRSPRQPFICTPGAGMVRCPGVTAPPHGSSFHHPAPALPQELKALTCWDMSPASRGEGRTRARVEPPWHCAGHGTDEGSSAPRGLLLLPEEGAQAVCCVGAPTHPPRVLREPPRCPAFLGATDLR